MRKIRKPAFTLVELIIVIAIIGVLFAMLIPTVSSAWAVASMAKCQVNLNRMWQAQILRRSDKDQTLFTSGGVWPAMLAPYLERSSDVFHCPEGPERPDLMPMVTTEADLYDTVGGNNEAQQNAPAPNNQTQGFALSDLTFRMYSRHWAGYTDGQYLGTAVADSTVGVKREDLGGGKISLGIDDRSFFSDHSVDAGNLDYRDIRIVVLLQDNRLKQIEFVGSDNGTGSSYVAFKFEVWLADEMISDDFYRDVGMV
ncbi:MAG: type II secretion system protein, partial [Planctomycetota bacterium]|nr:type II secretion system protein [Planctomycetota bacterium]